MQEILGEGGAAKTSCSFDLQSKDIHTAHKLIYNICGIKETKYTKALEEGENNEEKVERCCFKPNRLSALLTLLKFYSSSTAFKDHTKEQNLEDK